VTRLDEEIAERVRIMRDTDDSAAESDHELTVCALRDIDELSAHDYGARSKTEIASWQRVQRAARHRLAEIGPLFCKVTRENGDADALALCSVCRASTADFLTIDAMAGVAARCDRCGC
jgi:hypothetical protein